MAIWIPKKDGSPYDQLELFIAGVIPLIFIILGTLGNVISILILCKKENRNKSTHIYLIFLCVSDTISLYQWNLNYIVYQFSDGTKEIMTQSLFLCKWVIFLSFYSLHASAMFLTFVELDRACLLRNQWYKQKIAQPKMALIIASTTLIILFAMDGFLFGLGVEFSFTNSETGVTERIVVCYYTLNEQYNRFFVDDFPWVL